MKKLNFWRVRFWLGNNADPMRLFKDKEGILDRLFRKLKEWVTLFYYQKYFEYGLPMRRFAQVHIETNNLCTRKCHFCLYGVKSDVPATRMPASLFFKIVDELALIKFDGRFSLFNNNEPLTDKRIFDFIKYSSLMLPGSFHLLVTNGDLLSVEKVELLFENGLDCLVINSYDNISLDRNKSIYHGVPASCREKVSHIDRTAYTDWVSRAGHVKIYAKKPVAGYCDWINYAVFVKPDGRVLACCHDFDSVNLMGDLSEQSLEEVWYGRAYSWLRKNINKGGRAVSELCSHCDHESDLDYFRSNHLMSYANGKTGLFFTPEVRLENYEAAQLIKNKYHQKY